MGIYLPNMEMPKEGHLIIRIYASGEVCEPTECAGVWGKVATAVPVPPHGDLIDRDTLDVTGYCGTEGREDTFDDGVIWLAEQIDLLPTIIPAEEDE